MKSTGFHRSSTNQTAHKNPAEEMDQGEANPAGFAEVLRSLGPRGVTETDHVAPDRLELISPGFQPASINKRYLIPYVELTA